MPLLSGAERRPVAYAAISDICEDCTVTIQILRYFSNVLRPSAVSSPAQNVSGCLISAVTHTPCADRCCRLRLVSTKQTNHDRRNIVIICCHYARSAVLTRPTGPSKAALSQQARQTPEGLLAGGDTLTPRWSCNSKGASCRAYN